MLIYPNIDPVALQFGPLKVHWYGLMYLIGFCFFLFFAPKRAKRQHWQPIKPTDIDALLFYGVLGIIIGGRLGEVLFYQPQYYFTHPSQIIAIWSGGMSFHGGLISVLIAMGLWGRKEKVAFLKVTDFIAPFVPIGLLAGRIGNFINGELWGRVSHSDLPWIMIFGHVDTQPRHPSQLYEALAEGLLLWLLLWAYSQKPRHTGSVSGLFLLGYGIARWICEYFREPEYGLTIAQPPVTMGQWLSLPMIVIGLLLLWHSHKKRIKIEPGEKRRRTKKK